MMAAGVGINVTISYFALIIIVSNVLAKNCRPLFPGYHIDGEHDAINQGCYHSPKGHNLFPLESKVNFRGSIDWKQWNKWGHAGDMVKQCGQLALNKGARYFGIEYYGECYYGDQLKMSAGSQKVTTRDDCQSYCAWDVGGPDAIMVYAITSVPKEVCPSIHVGYSLGFSHWAINRGCFQNPYGTDNVFNHKSSNFNFRGIIDWFLWHDKGHAGDIVQKCGKKALEAGAHYFGITFFGVCYYGSNPDMTVAKVNETCLSDCYYDIGGRDGIIVYKII